MSYLLDTNIISELVKTAPNPSVLQWIDSLESDELFLSVITLGEIRNGASGIKSKQKQDKISHWLEVELPAYFQDRILAIDRKVVDMWGRLQDKTAGYNLPAIDGLIAATAHVHGLKLVTRNIKDFLHIDIQVINPWPTR